MGIQISPFGNSQFTLNNGYPAIGWKLFVYEGRSTSKAAVYTDKDGLGRHENPITLDSNGFTPQPIYIDTTKTYKFTLAVPEDLDPPTLPMYVVDQVTAGLETPTVSTPEWSTGSAPTYVGPTQFSVEGNQTSTYHTGRRVKVVTASGALYGTVQGSAFGAVTTVTVTLDAGSLDVTLSAVYYSFLSAAGSAWPGGYNNGTASLFTGPVSVALRSSFNLIPVGSIFLFGGSAAPPAGYYLCDGAALSRTGEAALFAAFGTIFGPGDGSTSFNLPNIPNIGQARYIVRYA